MRTVLSNLLAEPRIADPPVRVWRDWALLAVVLGSISIELIVGPEIVWPIPSLLAAVVIGLSLLWRRTHPLAMFSVAFGSTMTLTLLSLIIGAEWQGLNSMVFVLIPVYSLYRWGSGRDGGRGIVMLIAIAIIGNLGGSETLGDVIGGTIVLFFPMVLGGQIRSMARSRVREVEKAQMLEREQLARELHDVVAHHVSAIAVQAQAGREVARTRPEAAVEALVVIEEEASRTLAEMRIMVGALRDGQEAELAPQRGVVDIEKLSDVAGDGPRVNVELIGDLATISPSVDAALYRLAQESITNARRHARRAESVAVRVDGTGEQVRLSVSDDGEPVSLDNVPIGYGLVGMAERAKLLGGTLEAGPTPGRGWTVVAELPRDGMVRM